MWIDSDRRIIQQKEIFFLWIYHAKSGAINPLAGQSNDCRWPASRVLDDYFPGSFFAND